MNKVLLQKKVGQFLRLEIVVARQESVDKEAAHCYL